MGQDLFEPPNVSGWVPDSYWLTTSRICTSELVALLTGRTTSATR